MRYAKRTRALVAVLVAGFVAASCSGDNRITAPRSAAPATANSLGETLGGATESLGRVVGTLMTCRPLPYAWDSKVIGPAGGELNFGPHTFRVPAGALSRSVRITGVAPSDNVNSVKFWPEGLHFDRPAALTLSYANCDIITSLLPRVAYTTDALQILEFVPSIPNISERKVTGKIEHFSRYAASW